MEMRTSESKATYREQNRLGLSIPLLIQNRLARRLVHLQLTLADLDKVILARRARQNEPRLHVGQLGARAPAGPALVGPPGTVGDVVLAQPALGHKVVGVVAKDGWVALDDLGDGRHGHAVYQELLAVGEGDGRVGAHGGHAGGAAWGVEAEDFFDDGIGVFVEKGY